MLSIDALEKRYGTTVVLSGLSHDFAPGVSVMVGRSGAGKSTLLRLLATVEQPTAGRVMWRDKTLGRRPRAYRAGLGYAPQRVDFPEMLTGMEFLEHIGALKGLRRAQVRGQGSAILARLGLDRSARTRIATYSGGMRRRLGLAQALLGAPDILLLDEPTAELDAATADEVHALIWEIADAGTQVVMTTHLTDGLADYPHAVFEIG